MGSVMVSDVNTRFPNEGVRSEHLAPAVAAPHPPNLALRPRLARAAGTALPISFIGSVWSLVEVSDPGSFRKHLSQTGNVLFEQQNIFFQL